MKKWFLKKEWHGLACTLKQSDTGYRENKAGIREAEVKNRNRKARERENDIKGKD
jgi:hypothetical protein